MKPREHAEEASRLLAAANETMEESVGRPLAVQHAAGAAAVGAARLATAHALTALALNATDGYPIRVETTQP